jgi:uncharacterized protein (DUF2062 family)
VRTRLINTLRNAGSPHRTATAFALGVFLGFSPFLGFQMAIGFSTALAFRLSRVVMFAGLCVNLPWLMLPWYTLTTAAGAFVLRLPLSVDLGPSLSKLFGLSITAPAFWTQAIELAAPFLWSFIFGSTAGALVLAALAYFIVKRYLTSAAWRTLPDAAVETASQTIARADTAR